MSKFGGNSRNVRSNIHNFERRNPYLVCHVLATIASAKLKFLWGGPPKSPSFVPQHFFRTSYATCCLVRFINYIITTASSLTC